mmetsp:Transcript_15769/g.42380  ORF Transcript_15769/g.42380 Transcript_15769/m.42380 type:complete len:464 (-) Transcript_15769:387-1778(-)
MGLTDAQIETLNKANLGFLVTEIQQTQHDADAQWLLYASALVFFMQTGFAMLCAGLVRAKNTKNILLKNVLDACAGALGFWSLGYAFAYGEADGGNPFIGNTHFFMTNWAGQTYQGWLFQFAFAATAATIVSGAVAERTKMAAYLCYSFALTAFIYPVVAHWVWASAGWISAFNANPLLGTGVIDFAGCGVVHMVGGVAALSGAWVVGPRLGRYDPEGNLIEIPGHSATLQALGTFILWVGWYGFNPGSTLAITGLGDVAGKTAVTTTLSAASGAVACLGIFKMSTHAFDLNQTLNGALAGLVSITAGCSVVEPYAAVIIGAIGALVYTGWAEFVKRKLRIDDVVDASAVHFACGAWGLLAAALFATKENYEAAYGVPNPQYYGAFYAPVGNGHQMFVCAIIAIFVITAWVAGLMIPFFYALKFANLLRSPPEEEEAGMDVSKHGGSAYPDYVVTSSTVVTKS